MKSTKAYKNILLIVFLLFVSAVCAATLAACSTYDAEQSIIEEGYVHLVTYDANGGDFDSSPSREQETAQVRVADNSLTVEPGYRPEGVGELDIITQPTRSGYKFLYWELVETNENGAEITRQWNFYTDRVTSDITLRAVWERNSVLYVSAIVDGEVLNFREISMEAGRQFISVIYSTNSEGVYSLSPDTIRSTYRSLTADNETYYTPLSFYWLDEEGNKVPLSEENAVYADGVQEMRLYAEVIEGQFTFVTQESVARLTLSSNSYWYLLEDIDLSQSYDSSSLTKGNSWSALNSFDGIIYGNGYTISNVWVNSPVTSNAETFYHSIFGTMNGRIEDLTFNNVQFTVSSNYFASSAISHTLDIAFLANSFGNDGVFDNVTLTDCSITVVNASISEGTITNFTYNIAADNNLWIEAPVVSQSVIGTVAVNENVEDMFIAN